MNLAHTELGEWKRLNATNHALIERLEAGLRYKPEPFSIYERNRTATEPQVHIAELHSVAAPSFNSGHATTGNE